MGKPVKVADDLYEALQREAQGQGITLQETLQAKLAAYQSQIKELGKECRQLETALRQEREELTKATKKEQSSKRELATRKKEIETLQAQLQQVEEERACLDDRVEEMDGEIESMEQEGEKAGKETQLIRNQANAAFVILGIFAGVALLYFLWQRRQQHREERERVSYSQPPMLASPWPWNQGV